MGKLPPSMRSAKVPLSLLKSTPTPAPSPSPMPHYLTMKSKSKPKTKTSYPNPNPNIRAINPPPMLFSSPSLSSAISTSTSLLSSPSPPSLNSLLQSFCQAGATAADAISFLNHLSSSTSFAPDKSAFHILLYHCISSSSDISPVLRVFNLMSESNYPPDAASLDLSIRALCSSSKSPRLDDACSLILKSSVKPDEYTYNFLVRRLARDRPVSSVNHFIEHVRSKLSIQPNVVTYTILIDAWCCHGNLREATRLVKMLSDNGFKPDAYVYNTIMKGHCMLDDYGGVMDIYNKMKDEGVEPDLVTYNTLLFGLSKAGMMPSAKRIMKLMADSGQFPDVVTYTSLMNGMCRKGEAREARALLTEMEEKGLKPNDCTYNTLVMGLCKAQYLDEALELYHVMIIKGMKMDGPTYASLVRTLCRAGRISDAYEVFDFVIESKSLPEVSAYTGLDSSIKWVQKRFCGGLNIADRHIEDTSQSQKVPKFNAPQELLPPN